MLAFRLVHLFPKALIHFKVVNFRGHYVSYVQG